jgi:hypothetical protein
VSDVLTSVIEKLSSNTRICEKKRIAIHYTTRRTPISAILAHALHPTAAEDEAVEGGMISLPFPPPLRDMIGGYVQ